MARKREILVPHGLVKKLIQNTGLCEVTVRNALRGVTDTDNSTLVRKRALEMGGVIAKK